MPSIKDAIAANNERIAIQGPMESSTPQNSFHPLFMPPQDAPAGLGLPQRGMFSADLVQVSDRSDNSRVFRSAGMRSPVFPYSQVSQKGSAPVVVQAPTTIIQTITPTPTPTPSPSTPSGPGNLIFATPDGVAGPADLRSLVNTDLPDSGVVAGSYTNTNLSVNSKGVITAAANGSASGVNKTQATITFFNPLAAEDTTAQVVVTGQAWVSAGSIIVVSIAGGTANHPDPDEPAVEDIVVTVGNLVVGVGFTISAYAPNGTWGSYFVNAIGTS